MKTTLFTIAFAFLGSVAFAQTNYSPAGVTQPISFLRLSLTDFYLAFDRNSADQTAAVVQKHWQSLPAELRARIEDKHPGTTQRLTNLRFEYVDSRQSDDSFGANATSNNAFVAQSESLRPTAPKSETTPNPPPATGMGGLAAISDLWTHKTPTADHQESSHTRPTVRYSDDLDIFGDRPVPAGIDR
jgi:hypothetical protein